MKVRILLALVKLKQATTVQIANYLQCSDDAYIKTKCYELLANKRIYIDDWTRQNRYKYVRVYAIRDNNQSNAIYPKPFSVSEYQKHWRQRRKTMKLLEGLRV